MTVAEPVFEGKVDRHRKTMNALRAQRTKERLFAQAAAEKLDLGSPENRWTLWLRNGEEAHSLIELGGFAASLQELLASVARNRSYILQELEAAIILEARGVGDFRVIEYVCFEG